jgi:tubulin-folding cofactor B
MAATAADIPLLIVSENASSERRTSPSWSVAHLKSRLEPITGIPSNCQRLSLKVGSQTPQVIEAADEEVTQLSQWPLQAYAEIHVGIDQFLPNFGFSVCM